MILQQMKELGDSSSHIFLNYISKNIANLQQKSNKIKKKSSPLQHKIEEQIEFFSKMREHYYISLKQSISNGAAPDPQLNSLLISLSSRSFCTLAKLLVYGSLTNYETFLKHQMISIDESMFEQFQKVKMQLFNPLVDLEQNEQITLEQTIRKTQISLNKIVDSYSLTQYLNQLEIMNNKPLVMCKQQIVIEQNQQQQTVEEKGEVLKINNSSSESQKPKKNVIPNYQGDEQVFTGDSDHNIHQKKFTKKYGKKKKNNKKYVEEQNYEASQEEDKHKKNRHIIWRHHNIEQGFDTDKEKK